MQLYCLSDDQDTLVGMRLAGIDGMLITQTDALEQALSDVTNDPDIGIVLITHSLADLDRQRVEDIKLHCSRPLIMEIPAPGDDQQTHDGISRYIQDAIGLKL